MSELDLPAPETAAVPTGSALGRGPGLLVELSKIRITLMVTVTTAAGFLLFTHRWVAQIWTALAGTLLVACSAAALNHLQDQRIDARMKRTVGRPLPSGRIDRSSVVLLTIVLAGLGFAALATAAGHPIEAMGFAALAMLWYNGVYAWSKRVTAFAAVPGAVIGALPPVIGWVAAGGSSADLRIWAVAAFFFLWQTPHFWLILLRTGDDYENAGLPSLTARLGRRATCRLTWIWLVATSVSGPMAAAMAGIRGAPLAAVATASIWLCWTTRHLLSRPNDPRTWRSAFARINAYALLFTAALIAGSLTRL